MTHETYSENNNANGNPISFTKTSRYTFHSPDIHFVNPTIGTELNLETEEYGQSEGFFNKCEDEAKYKLLSTAAMTFAFVSKFNSVPIVGLTKCISGEWNV